MYCIIILNLLREKKLLHKFLSDYSGNTGEAIATSDEDFDEDEEEEKEAKLLQERHLDRSAGFYMCFVVVVDCVGNCDP